MTVALVTGGNKGLGRETARRLVKEGHTVYIGARSVEHGQLAATEIGAQFVQLDVTDDASVASALEAIGQRDGHLDVLVNNAGIGLPALTGLEALQVFDTNAVGIIRVTQDLAGGVRRPRPAAEQARDTTIYCACSGAKASTRCHIRLASAG